MMPPNPIRDLILLLSACTLLFCLMVVVLSMVNP